VLNEPRPAIREPEFRSEPLQCRRTGLWFTPADHVRCAYCFGDEVDVETGLYDRFCDFVPGRDPIHFGFPEDGVRDRLG